MAFPRLPVKTRASMNGVDFTIVVLHLKAGQGEDDETRRRDAVAKLDTWTRGELAAGVERDVLLIGDLNDEPTDPLGDNIFTPFTDAGDTYRLLTQSLAEGGEYTFIPFHSMLDHAVITTDMVTELGSGAADILELELTVDNYSTNVSDHRPLLVKLRP
jgi:endonuclease/exonuclease/phosphatase family metal-dependent hydrolase